MTLAEFKAWFEGFSETMEAAPNEKQWERIKARVAEISSAPISYPVYVDRYVEPYRRYWPSVPYWSASSGPLVGATSLDAKSSVSMSAGSLSIGATHSEKFEPLSAMKAAGLAEYRSVLNS